MENVTDINALLAEFETTLKEVDSFINKVEADVKALSELPARVEFVDPARKNYEDTLGKALGGPLYDAISDALDKDTLGEHADKFVEDSIKSLSEKLKKMEGVDDDAADAIDKLAEVLVQELGTLASDFIKGEGAVLVDAVQDVVDENPLFVATMALVAAALAVILNMEIPELKAKFKLTDKLAVEVGANLGRLQDITLERLQTKITLELGDVTTSAKILHTPDDTSSRMDFRYRPSDAFSAGGYLGHSMRDGITSGADLSLRPSDALSLGARVDFSDLDGTSGGVNLRMRPSESVNIGARMDFSERDGNSAGVDMRLRPSDAVNIGARMDFSERDGVSGGLDMNLTPAERLNIAARMAISEREGVSGCLLYTSPSPRD